MTIQEIQEQSRNLILNLDYHGAIRFALKLEESLRDNNVQISNPQAFQSISRIAFSLYVFAIAYVSNQVFERIFIYNLKEAISLEIEDWDFVYQLETRFFNLTILNPKELMRDGCIPLLKKTKQNIGSQPLYISMEAGTVEPSIPNWIKYYDRKTGPTNTSNLDRSRFFSSDDAMVHLSSQDKRILRDILTLYDYLRTDQLLTVTPLLAEESDTTTSSILPPTQESVSVAPSQTREPAQTPQPSTQTKSGPTSLQKSQTIDLKKMMEDKRS